MAKKELLEVFYDGGCMVCDSEVNVYKKIGSAAELFFVNIADSEFDPQQYGRSRDEFMAQLHVRDEAGNFHVGVDAFRLLWRRLPGLHYHLLAALTGLPGINLFARIGYRLFAENRHRLPKKR